MEIVSHVQEMKDLSQRLRAQGKPIGFVPTMGFFHEGHLSLMRRARGECDILIVSIFVNPTQFVAGEDYESYPRDMERDLRMAAKEGVDIVFAPTPQEMYPEGYSTYVNVENLTERLCGEIRPGHFRGVTTVVTKLFNIVQPHRAYFGEKDYQQLVVIERMVRDLNMDVEIIRCPTVRDPDGLAASSRNIYLNLEERRAARVLYRALKQGELLFNHGIREAEQIKRKVKEILEGEPLVEPQYVEVVDGDTLEDVSVIEGNCVIALAARVGKARLIDNIILTETEGKDAAHTM